MLARLTSRMLHHQQLRQVVLSRPIGDMLDVLQPGQPSDASLDAALSIWQGRDTLSDGPRQGCSPGFRILWLQLHTHILLYFAALSGDAFGILAKSGQLSPANVSVLHAGVRVALKNTKHCYSCHQKAHSTLPAVSQGRRVRMACTAISIKRPSSCMVPCLPFV